MYSNAWSNSGLPIQEQIKIKNRRHGSLTSDGSAPSLFTRLTLSKRLYYKRQIEQLKRAELFKKIRASWTDWSVSSKPFGLKQET